MREGSSSRRRRGSFVRTANACVGRFGATNARACPDRDRMQRRRCEDGQRRGIGVRRRFTVFKRQAETGFKVGVVAGRRARHVASGTLQGGIRHARSETPARGHGTVQPVACLRRHDRHRPGADVFLHQHAVDAPGAGEEPDAAPRCRSYRWRDHEVPLLPLSTVWSTNRPPLSPSSTSSIS
jgi:hypothetical protein